MAKTAGERLTWAREEAGLTMSQLAEKAGVSPAGVSLLERGKRQGSTATLRKLALALGVTASWLAYGDEPSGEGKERAS